MARGGVHITLFTVLMLLALPVRAGTAEILPAGLMAGTAQALDDTAFYDEAGHERRIGDFKGGLLVVNLWASWCGPCIIELPSLASLRAALKDEGVEVLALSLDRGGAPEVKRFFARHPRPDLLIGFDPRGRTAEPLKAAALPTTIIIDRTGREIARAGGALDWAAPDMVAWLRMQARRPVPHLEANRPEQSRGGQ